MRILFVFVILGILLGGLFIFIYFFFEIPQQQVGADKVNVTIFITNENNKLIEANYQVLLDGIDYKIGKSSSRGAILEEFNTNKTIEIKAYKDGFYPDFIKFYSDTNKRLNFRLIEPGEIEIRQNDEIEGLEGEADIIVLTNKAIKYPHFCIKWSPRFIYVKSDKYEQIEIDRYDDYDKCFYSGLDELLSTSNIRIPLSYKVYGDLKSKDYVNITVFDALYIDDEFDFNNTVASKEHELNINNI